MPLKRQNLIYFVNRLSLITVLVLLAALVAPMRIDTTEPLWAEATDLQAHKSYTAAIEIYEQIAALNPPDPRPLSAMGDIYVIQHRWPLAEDAFNRALARNNQDPQALVGLGIARWEQGDKSRAVSLWEEVLEDNRDAAPAGVRLRLALAYLDMDRLADSKAMLHQEVAYSNSPASHLYLAMIQAMDDVTQAQLELAAIADDSPPEVLAARDYLSEAFETAATADSTAGIAKALGLAFVQIEEWQLARASLERSLVLDPTDGETMAFLGYTEAQLGNPAFALLAGAVESRPNWPLGHYLLGLYYLEQEAYEFAAEEFQATLRLDPGNAQAHVDLAHAYIGQGQYLDAEAALSEAVKSAPDDLTFHLALVHFYADHTFRVTDRGLAAAQAAADLAPEDPEVRDLLGWMYFLAGDPAMARVHLENALRLDPELTSAHYHLGALHNVLGEEEAARFAFLRAIDLDTDGFYRNQAQKALWEMTHAH